MGSLGAILDQYFALFVQGPRGQFSWRGQYQNGTRGPSSVWAEPPRPRGVPQDLRAVCHYQGSILVYLFFAKISELFFLSSVSPTAGIGTPTRRPCDLPFPEMRLGIPSLWVWV